MMEAFTQEGDNTCSSPIKKKGSFTGLDSKQSTYCTTKSSLYHQLSIASYWFNLSQRKEGHNKE